MVLTRDHSIYLSFCRVLFLGQFCVNIQTADIAFHGILVTIKKITPQNLGCSEAVNRLPVLLHTKMPKIKTTEILNSVLS